MSHSAAQRALGILLGFLCVIGCKRHDASDARARVVIGSKVFTESVILGEIATRLAQSAGADAAHKRELGGTRIVFDALVRGDVDVYPEYTGTITNEIFAGQDVRGEDAIRQALARQGIEMTASLGFNDTYALGMRENTAAKLGIRTISDLARHPDLRLGFSNEFLDRKDGWPALRAAYRLHHGNVTGLDHDLAYRALAGGGIDLTDLYSTDAEIQYYSLRVLVDDRNHFPEYKAVYLYRSDLRQRAPKVVAALGELEGKISARQMIAMNARAKLTREPEAQVAANFLESTLGIGGRVQVQGLRQRLWQRTVEHLQLVGASLLAAILVSIPIGVIAARQREVGQVILSSVAAIYTIPSLALLAFMVPRLGIGWWPAVVALFLYSLLPMVRNTHAGLLAIPTSVRESAEALGLPPRTRLWRIELPLASPAVLAGIKTSAVINVGTATLGALVGAGGYGQPILTGIRLDNTALILEGAIPAAVLALLVQGLFGLLERVAVPRGLRLNRA